MLRFTPLLLMLLAACSGPGVSWTEISYQNAPPQPRDALNESRPSTMTGCDASLRVAESDGSAFATWWQVRPDSSAALMVSRSMHGGPWEAPVVADSTDRSRRGCARPPPAIVADGSSGYVHIAYFLEQPGGPGVFFAHSMDSASTFHWPVPIIFGNNPSRVSIDALGDRVVVAWEDPNANQPMIGISLSKTMGHIFERRMLASSANGRAKQPVVRLEGDSIRLWWSEYSADQSVSATRPTYRTGYIQAR